MTSRLIDADAFSICWNSCVLPITRAASRNSLHGWVGGTAIHVNTSSGRRGRDARAAAGQHVACSSPPAPAKRGAGHIPTGEESHANPMPACFIHTNIITRITPSTTCLHVSSSRTIARTMLPSMTSVSSQIWRKGVPRAHSYTTCPEGEQSWAHESRVRLPSRTGRGDAAESLVGAAESAPRSDPPCTLCPASQPASHPCLPTRPPCPPPHAPARPPTHPTHLCEAPVQGGAHKLVGRQLQPALLLHAPSAQGQGDRVLPRRRQPGGQLRLALALLLHRVHDRTELAVSLWLRKVLLTTQPPRWLAGASATAAAALHPMLPSSTGRLRAWNTSAASSATASSGSSSASTPPKMSSVATSSSPATNEANSRWFNQPIKQTSKQASNQAINLLINSRCGAAT